MFKKSMCMFLFAALVISLNLFAGETKDSEEKEPVNGMKSWIILL